MSVDFFMEGEQRFTYPDTINMSNVNAQMVLDKIGIIPDDPQVIYGSMDADVFLGHVLTALSLVDTYDHGVAPAEWGGDGSARVIDMGLQPGYFEMRLKELADLATKAMRQGKKVVWA